MNQFLEMIRGGGSSGHSAQQIAVAVFKLPDHHPVRDGFVRLMDANRNNARTVMTLALTELDERNAVDEAIHFYCNHDILDHLEGMREHAQREMFARLGMLMEVADAMNDLVNDAHRHMLLIGPEILAHFPPTDEVIAQTAPPQPIERPQ